MVIGADLRLWPNSSFSQIHKEVSFSSISIQLFWCQSVTLSDGSTCFDAESGSFGLHASAVWKGLIHVQSSMFSGRSTSWFFLKMVKIALIVKNSFFFSIHLTLTIESPSNWELWKSSFRLGIYLLVFSEKSAPRLCVKDILHRSSSLAFKLDDIQRTSIETD